METKTIRVLLVDDHPVVRTGFRRLLEVNTGVVVAEADSGEEAVQLYEKTAPDVVVLDLSMPGMGGLETARRILARDGDARLLVFSVHDNEAMLSRALQAGVLGYLTKQSAPATLLEAVHAVAEGKMYIDPDLVGRALGGGRGGLLERLTPREFEVFRLLAEGHSVNDIAGILNISPKTAGVHHTRIMHKLEVTTSVQLVRLALRHGVITP
ncbi:MAG: DNA-binding response regulator [Gammaproteobacteria bacterium HGW-Gammaproteobacteria-1]|jgi:two-component system invasion response regulator UvrY|nr:MAG: DNA-binding response regulator [Gammaproteobacteria bacterium HGW-Gammaproteobacteria-1]